MTNKGLLQTYFSVITYNPRLLVNHRFFIQSHCTFCFLFKSDPWSSLCSLKDKIMFCLFFLSVELKAKAFLVFFFW